MKLTPILLLVTGGVIGLLVNESFREPSKNAPSVPIIQDSDLPPEYKIFCNGEKYTWESRSGFRNLDPLWDTREKAVEEAWRFYQLTRKPIPEPDWTGWKECPKEEATTDASDLTGNNSLTYE